MEHKFSPSAMYVGAGLGIAIAIAASIAQGRQLTVAERQPPVVELDVGARAVPAKNPLVLKASTVWLPVERTAVALEFVVERDADDKVTKIHRFILWSDGRVTFPNIPYYAQLVFSCRDCPRPSPICPEDIDGDGKITVLDLLRLNSKMGQKCPDP